MTTPSTRRRSLATAIMSPPRVSLLAMLLAATACLSAPPPTFAVQITYIFDPPVTGLAELMNQGKIEGTFKFDANLENNKQLLDVDLMVSGLGSNANGEYNIPAPSKVN